MRNHGQKVIGNNSIAKESRRPILEAQKIKEVPTASNLKLEQRNVTYCGLGYLKNCSLTLSPSF